jgi:hypothetical protein
MKNMRSASSEGEEPMSVTQVVYVLAENTKKICSFIMLVSRMHALGLVSTLLHN